MVALYKPGQDPSMAREKALFTVMQWHQQLQRKWKNPPEEDVRWRISARRGAILGGFGDGEPPTEWTPVYRVLHDPPSTDADIRRASVQLRWAYENASRVPKHIWKELRTRQVPSGLRATQVWTRLRRAHIRSRWPALVRHLRVSDLVNSAPRKWDVATLYKHAGRRIPFEVREMGHEPGGVMRQTGFADFSLVGLPLGEIVDAQARPWHPVNERTFVTLAIQDLRHPASSMARFDDDIPMELSDAWDELFKLLGKNGESAQDALVDFAHSDEGLMSLGKRKSWYDRQPRSKRDGRTRWLDIPSPRLGIVQRRLANVLGAYRTSSTAATGFLRDRSTLLHAAFHKGAAAAITIDLRDFFSHVTRRQVTDVLNALCSTEAEQGRRSEGGMSPFVGWTEQGLRNVVTLTVHPEYDNLPQGAATSPAMANMVAMELDRRIHQRFCEGGEASPSTPARPHRGWTFSRYADDLVLSTHFRVEQKELNQARDTLIELIEGFGWHASPIKTRTWTAQGATPLVICGVRVPAYPADPMLLPRAVERRVRAAFHHAQHGTPTVADIGLLSHAYAITGRVSYRLQCSQTTLAAVEAFAGSFLPADKVPVFMAVWLER